jgi:hypothetical protein
MSNGNTLNLLALSAALEMSMHEVSNFHSAADQSETLSSIDQVCLEANVGDAPEIDKIEEVINKLNDSSRWLRRIEAVDPETCLEYIIRKDDYKGCRLRVEKVGSNGLALLIFDYSN